MKTLLFMLKIKKISIFIVKFIVLRIFAFLIDQFLGKNLDTIVGSLRILLKNVVELANEFSKNLTISFCFDQKGWVLGMNSLNSEGKISSEKEIDEDVKVNEAKEEGISLGEEIEVKKVDKRKKTSVRKLKKNNDFNEKRFTSNSILGKIIQKLPPIRIAYNFEF